MPYSTCLISDCDKPAVKREWCNIHYNRLRRSGSIQNLPRLTLEERLWAKVDKSGDCWEWTGSRDKDGYGKILIKKNGKSQSTVAHRLAYILTYGEVGDNVKVDHRCFNHSCVNPAHLRATTHKENLENREGAQANSASGIRGVCWHKRIGKWVAQVKHAGTVIHVGYFANLEEAEQAAIAKRKELFTHNDKDRLSTAAGNA